MWYKTPQQKARNRLPKFHINAAASAGEKQTYSVISHWAAGAI